MYKLRPYQAEAKDAILRDWSEGNRKVLLVLPTGCGKTIVFASVIQDCVSRGRRALILAHREELLDQASDKLRTAYDLETVLEKGTSHSLGSDIPITVGSVQSLAQVARLEQFPPDYFDDIVVDETHHILSESYQRVVNHFPNANILGVTATPDRGDRKDLSKFFDKISYEYSLRQAVDQHYLCRLEAEQIPLEIDLSHVHMQDGDYAVSEIGTALDPYLETIAKEMLKYKDRKAVVFLPLIETSRKFCQMLNDLGFRAAEVNGSSPDRAEILKDFDEGKYNILCNAMLLTEGWDCPSVDCVVVLRPTKVRSLYCQMIGRGTRLYPGKDKLLILDFLWMTGKHDLCKPASLIAKEAKIAERMNQMMLSDRIDLLDAEEEAEEQEARESSAAQEREESLKRALQQPRRFRRRTVDPLHYAASICDAGLINYVPEFAWESKPATEKQISELARRGIDTADINRGFASKLIGSLKERQGMATPKQIAILEGYGFAMARNWTVKDASWAIGEIKRVGYKYVPFHVEDKATFVPPVRS